MPVSEGGRPPGPMDPRRERDSLRRTGPSRRHARIAVLLSLLLGTGVVGLGLVGDRARPPGGGVVLPVSDATAELISIRLPVEVNEQVEYWIGRFAGPQRRDFEAYLVREGLYGGMIRDRLRSRGMPEDLLYMAMIESGFLATAISPVTASGVWQFMQPTARAYGLDVDEWVDERLDPVEIAQIGHPDRSLMNEPPARAIANRVEVRLNNLRLGPPAIEDGWLVYPARPEQFAVGENLVGVRLARGTPAREPVQIEKLEAHVRYRKSGD